jgi:hypothetical protein
MCLALASSSKAFSAATFVWETDRQVKNKTSQDKISALPAKMMTQRPRPQIPKQTDREIVVVCRVPSSRGACQILLRSSSNASLTHHVCDLLGGLTCTPSSIQSAVYEHVSCRRPHLFDVAGPHLAARRRQHCLLCDSLDDRVVELEPVSSRINPHIRKVVSRCCPSRVNQDAREKIPSELSARCCTRSLGPLGPPERKKRQGVEHGRVRHFVTQLGSFVCIVIPPASRRVRYCVSENVLRIIPSSNISFIARS